MTFEFNKINLDFTIPKTFLELALKNFHVVANSSEEVEAQKQAKKEAIIAAAKDLDKQLEVFIADNYKQYLTRSRNGIRYYNVPTTEEFNKLLDFIMSSKAVLEVWGETYAKQFKDMLGSSPYAVPGHGIFLCEENVNSMLDALTDPEEFLRAKDFILAHEQGHIQDFESKGAGSMLGYLTVYEFQSNNPEQWTMELEYIAEAYAYRYTQEDVTFGVKVRKLIGDVAIDHMLQVLEAQAEEGALMFETAEARQTAYDLMVKQHLQFTRDSFIKSVSDTIIDKLMEGEVA